LNNTSVKGIVQGKVVTNLDSLPLPKFELLDMNYYIMRKGYIPSLDRYPQIRIATSRGCPFKCVFCPNSKRTDPVRYHSAAYVVRLLKGLVDDYGIKSVWFYDDEFLANKKRIAEFAILLKSSGLQDKLIWACQARATTITSDLAKTLRDSNCVCVLFGIESAAPKVLNYLKSGSVKIQDVERAISICQKNGLDVYGSFIFGAENESLQDMEKTLKWVNSHRRKGLTYAGFSILTPYPNTKVFDDALKKGILSLNNINYDKLVPSHDLYSVYLLNQVISKEDFSKFIAKAGNLFSLGNQINSQFIRGFIAPTSVKTILLRPIHALRIISGAKYRFSTIIPIFSSILALT